METLSMNADPGVALIARAYARCTFDSRKALPRFMSQSLRGVSA
jgi:hypothetical protein